MFSFSNANTGNPTQGCQQSSIPQQSADARASTLDRLTRVSDLPQDVQNLIEQLNQYITQQISISDQIHLSHDSLQESRDSVSMDVTELQRRWTSVQSSLRIDQNDLERARDQVHSDLRNVRISTTFIDGVRSGALNLRGSADQILKYFFTTANDVEEEAAAYDKIVQNVEEHLMHMRSSGRQQDAESLVATLRSQQHAFMSLAGAVAESHDRAVAVLE